MKKILHIISGLDDGGAEAVLYRLISESQSHSHEVISLHDAGKYGALLEEKGVVVHTLGVQGLRSLIKKVVSLYELVKRIDPDVLQTWMYHSDLLGGVIGKILGVPKIVWSVHTAKLLFGSMNLSTIAIARTNAIFSYVIPTSIVYCADSARLYHEAIFYCRSKGISIANGVDTNVYKPSSALRTKVRQELGIQADAFVIGHIGRFDPYKDYPTLFMALKLSTEKVQSEAVVLLGHRLTTDNESLRSDMCGIFEQLNIQLLGRRTDVAELLNAFDVFLLSSRSEAFPNVLLEAMACGVPCVSTDVGDARRIIGGYGWVSPAECAKELAQNLDLAKFNWKNSTTEWEKKKADARTQIVDNFSLQRMVFDYELVWTQ